MLRNANHLKGFTIHAKDGELGTVHHFLFDDETWTIRYLAVETGSWLTGRQVLISPMSVIYADWQLERLDVSLTQSQVKNSPDVDTQKPVSRQHEAEFMGYYGYPNYWGGPLLWGPALYPAGLGMPAVPQTVDGIPGDAAGMLPEETGDSHLRSSEEVTGYEIGALDGEFGHVAGFIVDDEVWAIRYLEVATRNWWPGKEVLVSPAWITEISWPEAEVKTGLTQAAIQNAPEYDQSMTITREYEDHLYVHYGRPPYWLHGAGHSVSA